MTMYHKPLVDYLEQLSKLETSHRAAAYKRAAIYIATTEKICVADVRKLPTIGRTIGAIVDRYCAGEVFPDVGELVDLFSGVHGAGPVTVAEWIKAGYKSLEDLPLDKLTHMQKCGVLFYGDLHTRIPRAEVELCVAEITARVRAISARHTVTAAGSYRRGASTSGDVDVLICGERSIIAAVADSILPAPIILSRGAVRTSLLMRTTLPNARWRIVDLLHIEPSAYYAALLYFTGSAGHVRDLRALAKSRGMRLNQNGIMVGSKLIKLRSEQHLYEILGLPYVEPESR